MSQLTVLTKVSKVVEGNKSKSLGVRGTQSEPVDSFQASSLCK